MEQKDAVQFLYRDLTVVSTDLALTESYDSVFEEEMQEYFPFNETIVQWLEDLYKSEKYSCFDENKLSLFYEKDHPFLFIRDMAHMNSWNLGYHRADRRDHITGLMFSMNPTFALESTLCLCRPSLVREEQGQWFDFKQAMTNLELAPLESPMAQAWKACGRFYLYFHLSQEGQSIHRQDIVDLLHPYLETLEMAQYEGSEALRQECGLVTRILRNETHQTIMDGMKW